MLNDKDLEIYIKGEKLMDKNKADACNIRTLTDKKNYISIFEYYTPTKSLFYYNCSFCFRELPNGGIRFDGVGACPHCFMLAHRLVDTLRQHEVNYVKNLGVQR
jgi:hypothetical protein